MSVTVVILLCALACPLGMGLMMLFMRKGHGTSRTEEAADEQKVPGRNAD